MSSPIQDLIRSLDTGSYRSTPSVVTRRSRARVRIQRRGQRLLKRFTWDATDNMFNLKEIMNNDNKIFLGVSDIEDLVTAEITRKRVESGKTTVVRETTVLCNRTRWADWAEKNYREFLLVETNASGGFVIEEATNNFIKYDVNSNSVTVRAFGDSNFAEDIITDVEADFSVVTSYIEWVYGSDGNSVNVPLNRERLPIQEMYPFLGDENLEDYYDRYMNSSANILLLIGPPGTGKTTFIRGLLSHTNSSAIVSYDSAILEKDGFFARFIEDDASVMVLEDSDAFLKSRSDGNTMMHRFLNVGDGLVTTKGKKLIFSTNLPSIRDIDSALIRPGRCFDILTFGELSSDEATALAKKLGVELVGGKDKYSLAEVFNQQSEQAKIASNRKVGFL